MKAGESRRTTIILSVVVCLVLAGLEPRAFAQQAPAANTAVHADGASAVPQAPHGSGKKKWIVVAAVAVGATIAIVFMRGKKTAVPTAPTFTAGPPSIG